MREAIRAHQSSSELIRAHQRSSTALSGARTSCCTTIPGPARRCTIFFSFGQAPHSAHRGRWALPLQLRQTMRRLTVASFSLPLYLMREAIIRSSNAIKRQSELLIAIVPDEGGNREAIRGHQRPSEPTRGHERASSVIERNQAQSSAIKSPSGGYERAHTKRNQA
jgi:hypothetical protein